MTAWLALNLGAVVAAVALALASGAGSRATPLSLTTLSGYLVLGHVLVLGTGLAGCLSAAGLGVAVSAVAGVAVWLARRPRPDAGDPDDHRAASAPAVFAALAAVVGAGLWAWPHLAGATRLWIWDDYTYHMVYPWLWLREHAIGAPDPSRAFTMQAWYPLSASVVATWFMAPWHGVRGDALAWVSLTGPLYAGLVATAAAALLARAGCRPGTWAVPLALLVTSPRVGIMASSFSDADLAVAAGLFGGLAFSVPRGADETGRELRTDAAYAGLLTGLALGVKVSAAPLALVVLLLFVLRARGPGTPAGGRTAVEITGVVAAAWLITGGYWYVRNVVHTGNPIYPAAFLGWPGTTFPETTLREYAAHYGLRRALADAFAVYADWPRSHAALAGLGLTGLAGWLALNRRSLPRTRRYFAGGSLAMAVIVLALQPFAPYSAGNAMTFRAGVVHWDSMRYVALVPILGWAALGFLIDALGGRWSAAASAVVVVAAVLTSPLASIGPPLALVGLALGVVTAVRPLRPRGGTRRRQAIGVGAGALALAAIVLGRHETKAAATAAAFQREPLFGAVVAVLDGQPAGTRVAVFGDQWIYPTFGARDHLRPIRLDRDGRVATQPIGDAMEPGNLAVEPATFRANLRASGVDVVLVVHLPHPGRSTEWPTQHAALETAAGAHLLHRDGAAAVWRLGP
jgi:hypothetical protein